MGRKLTGGWVESRGRWMARIGPVGADGKPTSIVLRGANGKPLGPDEGYLVPLAIARHQAEAIAKGQPPKDGAGGGWALGDLFREYLAWSARQGRRKSTLGMTAYRLRVFLAFVGDKLARDLNADDWFRFARGPGGAKREIFLSVRAAIRWAARPIEGREPRRVIESNPLADIRVARPKAERKPAPEWKQTRATLRALRAYGRAARVKGGRKRRDRVYRWLRAACVTWQAYTGCRTGEANGLTWAEVDMTAGVIRLDPKRVKTSKRRTLDMGRCRRLFEAISQLPNRGPRVFWAGNAAGTLKQHYRWLSKAKRWAEARGTPLPCGWILYDLRRGWATDAIEIIGEDAASAVLGHSPEVLRTIYDRPGDRRAKTAGEAVATGRRKKS